MASKYILVVGPCSTGTRLMRDLVSKHPDVVCNVMDRDWELGFPDGLPDSGGPWLLTWRSIPHKKIDMTTRLDDFLEASVGSALKVIVTSRSIGPAIGSASVHHYFKRHNIREFSSNNYAFAYKTIFGLLAKHSIGDFAVASLEGLIHERHKYLVSLWDWIGLRRISSKTVCGLFENVMSDVNDKYY